MIEPTDRDLVLRVRRGEADAYGELVRRYQASVYNVCYRVMGERGEAEDLAQEAFIRGFQKLATFDEDRSFGPWIRRVALNLCYNHMRRYVPPRLPLDDERDMPLRNSEPSPETRHIHRERGEDIRAAILELPPHYRVVIELRHYQEMTYADIAETLELPMSDVKSHLFRARRLLAKRLISYVQT
ncbi:MAG: sigma-70 family RNA polymerase sigma factor [Anaerolineales bacterium]|nr:sigma-70 family RNA polymerase sigma factor [Anaerolineales bacterium]